MPLWAKSFYHKDDADDDVFEDEHVGGFNEDSSQEMSQTLNSFNNETVYQGDNLVAQPSKVRCMN